MPQRLPITPESIYAIVCDNGPESEDSFRNKSTTYRGIAARMGYDPADQQVHAMTKSMAVSGYIKQNPFGAFHRGARVLPVSDAAADRRFADRLDRSAAAGNLVTHGPDDACSLGYWHEGPCPDPRLERQLALDDHAEDQGRVGSEDRQTCGIHRCWMNNCVGDPFHADRDNAVLDAAGKTRCVDESAEAMALRDRAEHIRRVRQPRPEDNPFTGQVTAEELDILDATAMSLVEHAEVMRLTAWMLDDRARNGNPRDKEDALFWHAAADVAEVTAGLRPDPATGRNKPAGVPPGGSVDTTAGQ